MTETKTSLMKVTDLGLIVGELVKAKPLRVFPHKESHEEITRWICERERERESREKKGQIEMIDRMKIKETDKVIDSKI